MGGKTEERKGGRREKKRKEVETGDHETNVDFVNQNISCLNSITLTLY